jgi:hypothetical protein
MNLPVTELTTYFNLLFSSSVVNLKILELIFSRSGDWWH